MKKKHNIIEPISDFSKKLLIDLFLAYYDARQNKRATANALKFEMDYEAHLFQLFEDIIARKYELSRSICFINFKPVQREIFAADFRDRIVHHLIFNYLDPIVEQGFIKDSYSCRVGKGTHYGIQRIQSFMRGCSQNFQEEAWILKLDILAYFTRINRQVLFDKIYKKLNAYNRPLDFDKNLLIYLLKKVIFHDPTQKCLIKGKASDWKGLPKSKSLFHAAPGKGFPIGNLTSQLFGNIYLNEFDHFVKEQLNIRYYGRYVDDFILIHQDKNYLKSLLPKIKAYLYENLGLEVHPRKIYFQPCTKGVQYLGTFMMPFRTYIAPRTKNNFYQCIQRWNQLIKGQKGKMDKKQLKKFIAAINSYLGTLKHYETYQLRKKMLWQLHPAFFNYVYISGGYAKLVPKIRKLKKKPLL